MAPACWWPASATSSSATTASAPRSSGGSRPAPLAPGVRVVDYGIRGMHLAYDLLDGYDALVLVDALPGGRRRPGTVRCSRSARTISAPASSTPHGMDPVAVLGWPGPAGRHAAADLRRGLPHRAAWPRASGSAEPSRPPFPPAIAAIRAVLDRDREPSSPSPAGGTDMCLGIPGRVVEHRSTATPASSRSSTWSAAERRVNVGMLESRPRAGDWVLIHMGFARRDRSTRRRPTQALAGLELMGRGPRRHPGPRAGSGVVRGLVQGVGFRPFVYVTAAALGLTGSVAQHPGRRGRRGRGRPGRGRRRSAAGCATTRRRWPWSSASHESELPAAGRHRLHHRGVRRRRPARTLASPDVATLRRLPARS